MKQYRNDIASEFVELTRRFDDFLKTAPTASFKTAPYAPHSVNSIPS